MNRAGGWWGLAGGAVIGLGIGTVQRVYPDISLLALLGVGLGFGALINGTIFIASRRRRGS